MTKSHVFFKGDVWKIEEIVTLSKMILDKEGQLVHLPFYNAWSFYKYPDNTFTGYRETWDLGGD